MPGPRVFNIQVPEDLVMSTADEYRERSEEYQLIQCAIPTHEKFSSDGYAPLLLLLLLLLFLLLPWPRDASPGYVGRLH